MALTVLILLSIFEQISKIVIPSIPEFPLRNADPVPAIHNWFASARHALGITAQVFCVFGVLSALSFSRCSRNFVVYYFFTASLQIFIIATLFMASSAVRFVELQVTAAVFASFCGLLFGGEIQDGLKGCLRLVGIGFILLFITAGLGFGIWQQVISTEPRDVTVKLPAVEDRDDLVRAIKTGLGANAHKEDSLELELSHTQVQTLVDWVLAVKTVQLPCKAELVEDHVECAVSLAVPGLKQSFLDIDAVASVLIEQGQFEIRLSECSIGKLTLSAQVTTGISSLIARQLNSLPEVQEFLVPIRLLKLSKTHAVLIGQRDGLRTHLQSIVHSQSELGPDEFEITRIYIAEVFENAQTYPIGDMRLMGAIRGAFRMASVRSRSGDPVKENRAALFALAYVVGDPRIEPLIGPVRDLVSPEEIRRSIGAVTIYGRNDWAKHYILSAVLTSMSNALIADMAGLWKERLDAHAGGSGYSFSDLLADEAGTRMARLCLLDPESAQEMQRRLSQLEAPQELMPAPQDLPEGIRAIEFDQSYGSGTNARFDKLRKDIRTRLDKLPLLRPVD